MPGDGQRDQQRELDFQRGDQLRILRDCDLPKNARGEDGKKVSRKVLKGVLLAIDQFGRGKDRGCTASLDRLELTSGVSRRHIPRALAILEAMSLVLSEAGSRRVGDQVSPMVRRTIIWSELALLCRESLFAPREKVLSSPPVAPQKHSALAGDHSAPGADHSAPGADHSAPGADHSAPGGTLNVFKRQRSEQEAPSDVPDVADDGARYFFEDEIAAIRQRANTLNGAVQAETSDDRELVLKIATLWEEGRLAEDMVHQALESFQRKREAGAIHRIRNGAAWLWTVLRNQCAAKGLRLEQLLAATDFPRELLLRPGEREVDGALIYTAAAKRDPPP